MDTINWGIIGCGDVTEIKSGPAFNKVKNSALVAVMRRDAEKAKDYARRHNVPKWYSDAGKLINDPDVNAIYVATPPSSHEEYTIAAINAGKPVYVEKPMSVDAASAVRMANAAREKNIKLVVAHYRRGHQLFNKVKQLINEGAIGEVRFVRSDIYKKSVTADEMANPGRAWRVDTSIAGGGLFNDLSPHQLDLMYYFFGEPGKTSGFSLNQSKQYAADDVVSGSILFKSGVLFSGIWCFNVAPEIEKDYCEIIGEKGKIEFSFFEHKPVVVTVNGKTETLTFDPLPHVQQPMIENVVKYLLGYGRNPCSGEEGVKVMELIDDFTNNRKVSNLTQ
ncbi:MAG: Gfo/Idh/MocA family protein [Chitinophagales bacterium]